MSYNCIYVAKNQQFVRHLLMILKIVYLVVQFNPTKKNVKHYCGTK